MRELILTTAGAPHSRCAEVTRSRMRDMLLSLAPMIVAAACFHGADWLLNLAAALVVSAACQILFNLPIGRRVGLGDLSFAVTGCLCALLLPGQTPFWAAAMAAATAQLIRALFGGLGRNWLNPALFGVCVVYATTLAGPGALDALLDSAPIASVSRLLGCATHGPAIGCSALLVALGWVYLLCKKLAKPFFSLSFLLAMVLPQMLFFVPVFQTGLLGPALAVALYCGSDSVTTPMFRLNQVVLGLILGSTVGALRFALGLDLSYLAILLAGPLARGLDALAAWKS